MIWTFLVSRGYSAASCSATQRNCCARIHSAFPGYNSGPSEFGPYKGKTDSVRPSEPPGTEKMRPSQKAAAASELRRILCASLHLPKING